MPKLPRPTGKEMIAFLQGKGFTVLRVRGSHHFLASGDKRTCVPVHANASLKIGTLRSILRDIDLDPGTFAREWMNS